MFALNFCDCGKHSFSTQLLILDRNFKENVLKLKSNFKKSTFTFSTLTNSSTVLQVGNVEGLKKCMQILKIVNDSTIKNKTGMVLKRNFSDKI